MWRSRPSMRSGLRRIRSAWSRCWFSGKGVLGGWVGGKWGFGGGVRADDLVMGAIYGGDVCTAVIEALNAGADLLLVAYDGAQFYRVFDCALDAYHRGTLDFAMLEASEARL